MIEQNMQQGGNDGDEMKIALLLINYIAAFARQTIEIARIIRLWCNP